MKRICHSVRLTSSCRKLSRPGLADMTLLQGWVTRIRATHEMQKVPNARLYLQHIPGLLDWASAIYSVLIVQVDAVDVQSMQRVLHGLAYIFWAALNRALLSLMYIAKLCGDHILLALTMDSLPYKISKRVTRTAQGEFQELLNKSWLRRLTIARTKFKSSTISLDTARASVVQVSPARQGAFGRTM